MAVDVFEDPDTGEWVTALEAVRRVTGSAWGQRASDLERELDRMQIARTRQPDADGLLGFRRRRLG
jgi:hypothetical protein